MIAQGTPEWFAQRLGHVTASRLSDVMAKGKTGEAVTRAKYRMQLVAERITGLVDESFTSAAMEWGVEQEKFARIRYEADTGYFVDEAEFCNHPTIKWLGASPDGIISGVNALIEIKCPNRETHLGYRLDNKPPSKYVNQMQCQMWVTGADWCDFVSYDPRVPEHLQLFISRLQRDNDLIAKMEIETIKFLSEVDDAINQLENKNV